MFIYVVKDDQRIKVKVKESWRIGAVKRQIWYKEELRIPIRQQALLFNGTKLDNDVKTLLDYKVTSKSYIMIGRTDDSFFVTVIDDGGFNYQIKFKDELPNIPMLKEKVSEEIDLSIQQFQLFFKGKELGGDSFLRKRLSTCDIECGSSIALKCLEFKFPVQLKTADGKFVTELFWATDTIGDLKEVAAENFSISFGCQKIYFEGKHLTFGTLSQNGLKSDSIVIVEQSLDSEFVIYVNILVTEEIVVIVCNPSDTIKEIKERIEEIEGTRSIHKRRFIFSGKHLYDDNRMLSEYNIQNGSTLDLTAIFHRKRM